MSYKIQVEDRVSTYPGRVTMIPVPGAANTYDMTRADLPIVEGTPVNKALFDSKADVMREDAIVYVTTTGSDVDGDGSTDAPFRSIQAAIDALPKNLGGFTVQISIGFGVYPERIRVEGFTSGRLVIGRPGEVFTINGITIVNSSFIETNIYQIERDTTVSESPFIVKDGSKVYVGSDMIVDGVNSNYIGIAVENNSHFITKSTAKITCNNCGMAVSAQWCSFVSLNSITGSNNVFGMSATQGSIVSYKTDTLSKMWSNNADSGGLVLTGNNSSDLSGATLDL